MYKRQMSFLLFSMISLAAGSVFASDKIARTVGDSASDEIFKKILEINGLDAQTIVGHFKLVCYPNCEPGKDGFVVIDCSTQQRLLCWIKLASCPNSSAQQSLASATSAPDVASKADDVVDVTPATIDSRDRASANFEKIPLTYEDLEGLGLGDGIYKEHGLIPPSTLCQEACKAVLTGCAIGMGISAAAATYVTVAKS